MTTPEHRQFVGHYMSRKDRDADAARTRGVQRKCSTIDCNGIAHGPSTERYGRYLCRWCGERIKKGLPLERDPLIEGKCNWLRSGHRYKRCKQPRGSCPVHPYGDPTA